MATSLSNLADSLTEGIRKIKCKDCDCFLEYESVKDNLIEYKFLFCSKDYSSKIDEELKSESFLIMRSLKFIEMKFILLRCLSLSVHG